MKEETCSSFNVPCRLVEIQDSMAWEKMQPGLGHVLGWGRVVELSFLGCRCVQDNRNRRARFGR